MKHIVQKQLSQSIATMQAVLADPAISDTVVTIAELTAKAMHDGHKLLIAGNGGSAADAQHLVAEFVARLTVNRPALRAVALTVDSSIITAIGNDFGFDDVFARQIEAIGQQGDIFLGISTSGNSKEHPQGARSGEVAWHHDDRLSWLRRRQDARSLRLQRGRSVGRHDEYPGVAPGA